MSRRLLRRIRGAIVSGEYDLTCSTYLPPMPPELTAELAAWDALSDEVFWEFEHHLEATA